MSEGELRIRCVESIVKGLKRNGGGQPFPTTKNNLWNNKVAQRKQFIRAISFCGKNVLNMNTRAEYKGWDRLRQALGSVNSFNKYVVAAL